MAETWTVLKVLQWTAGYLKEKGVEEGRLDAELLLADVLNLDRVGLYLNFDRPLTPGELASFRERVGRRARREPLQYILGKAEFWSLLFIVNPAVLIPRADTEVLVEEAVKRACADAAILDVGTGSGAIAVALARELPEAIVDAVDISAAALEVAAENVRCNGVESRVRVRQADLAQLPEGPFDLIVSNPPYIVSGELAALMPEVKDFEPRLALDGGEDGFDSYRILARQALSLLRQGGWLLLEAGAGQAPLLRELLVDAGLQNLFTRDDYAGIPRVVGGQKG